MIALSAVRGNLFTFIPDTTKGGPEITVAVDLLTEWVRANHIPITAIACEQEQAEKFYRDNGVEPHRLARITAKHLRSPVLLLDLGDGTHMLADGNHRYVVAAANGITRLPAWLVKHSYWQPFRVDMPLALGEETLRTMFSGIR